MTKGQSINQVFEREHGQTLNLETPAANALAVEKV